MTDKHFDLQNGVADCDTFQSEKITRLESFKNFVETQKGRLFEEQDAADLIQRTNRLIESLASNASDQLHPTH